MSHSAGVTGFDTWGMTGFLLGGILAFTVATAVECYLLLGRVQLLFNHAELILRALHTLLRDVPGKSAEHTLAALDETPRPWFQTLRRLAELGRHLDQVAGVDEPVEQLVEDAEDPVEDDPELARWADDGGPDPTSEGDRRRVLEPITAPAPRIDMASGLRLQRGRHAQHGAPRPTTVAADADQTDLALARFSFAEGYERWLRGGNQ